MTANESHAWRDRAFWIGAALAALVLLFLRSYAEMVRIWWTSSTFNHCLLIVPISAYLVWLKRHEVIQYTPGTSRLALVYIVLNSLLWLAGELLSVAFFQHLAVVGLLIGTIWALIGNAVFWLLLFPLMYLYFGVPEGEVLVPYLQDWTAQVLVVLLRLTGIPVYLEARHLTIPSGQFVVAEACSGINYLIATLAVGTMFAYLRYSSALRRAAFMVLAILVPLFANGARAYGIVMIAHLSDYEYAVGVDHIIYGWLFFGVVIMILFAIGNLFSDEDEPRPPVAAPALRARTGHPASMAGCVLALALTGPAIVALTNEQSVPGGTPMLPAVTAWRGPENIATVLDGTYHAATRQFAAVYESDTGDSVVVEIAWYQSESQGAELVSQLNSVFARRRRWQPLAEGVHRVQTVRGEQPVREFVIAGDTGELVVWSWYDIEGRATTSTVAGKLLGARARLAGNRHGSAAVAIATQALPDRAAAVARLRRFLAAADLGLPRLIETR